MKNRTKIIITLALTAIVVVAAFTYIYIIPKEYSPHDAVFKKIGNESVLLASTLNGSSRSSSNYDGYGVSNEAYQGDTGDVIYNVSVDITIPYFHTYTNSAQTDFWTGLSDFGQSYILQTGIMIDNQNSIIFWYENFPYDTNPEYYSYNGLADSYANNTFYATVSYNTATTEVSYYIYDITTHTIELNQPNISDQGVVTGTEYPYVAYAMTEIHNGNLQTFTGNIEYSSFQATTSYLGSEGAGYYYWYLQFTEYQLTDSSLQNMINNYYHTATPFYLDESFALNN